MPKPLKPVVLCDLDNSLVDRDAAFRRFAHDFMARHAKAFADHEPLAALQAILDLDDHGRKDRSKFCSELLAAFPGLPLTAAGLWQEHRHLPEFIQPDPQLLAVLAGLSQSWTLAVASNGSSAMQRQKMEKAGLTALFPLVFISGEMACQKPQAAFFDQIFRLCPSRPVAMVGDDYQNDMLPAHQRGLWTILIKPGPHTRLKAVDCQIPRPHRLKEALACMP